MYHDVSMDIILFPFSIQNIFSLPERKYHIIFYPPVRSFSKNLRSIFGVRP